MSDELIDKVITERTAEWRKSDDPSTKIKKIVEDVLALTAQRGIFFQETPKIVFLTHLVSIIGRLAGYEEPIEDNIDTFSEISDDSIVIAEAIADKINSYLVVNEIPKMEIMLIATHIEFAKYMAENSDCN